MLFRHSLKKPILILALLSFGYKGALFSGNTPQKTINKSDSRVIALDTQSTPAEEVQYTFSMIKPLAVQEGHTGDIISRIEKAGFRVIALRMRTLSLDEAKRFYAEHASKPFYMSLVQKMSSGPIVTMVLEKVDAISSMRQLVGATDPSKAVQGTLRYEFGRNTTDNAIHASDGPASAEREITFFFSQDELAE